MNLTIRARWLVGSALFLFGCLGLTWVVPESRYAVLAILRRERPHDGQSLRYWLYLLENGSADDRDRAARALGRLGPQDQDAVGILVETLQASPDDAWRLPFMPGDGRASERRQRVQSAAVAALGRIGPGAAAAVPVLWDYYRRTRDVDDQAAEDQAAEALAQVGAPTVALLSAALLDPQEGGPDLEALALLRRLGTRAREVVPILVRLIRDRSRSSLVRADAVFTLGALGPEPGEALALLLDLLRDPKEKWWVVSNAIGGVGRLGPGAKAAVPVLLDLLPRAQGADVFNTGRRFRIVEAVQRIDAAAAAAAGLDSIVRPAAWSPEQAAAVAAIRKLGGKVGIDNADPDNPVVEADLQRTAVTDADLKWLEPLGRLQRLDLDHTRVSDAGLVHLRALTKLRCLGLRHTNISGRGLAYLRGLAQLEELELAETRIDDVGLASLQGLMKLQRLLISDTPISDAGLVYLKGLTRLQLLFLVKTKITEAGAEALRKALPEAQVILQSKDLYRKSGAGGGRAILQNRRHR